MRHCCRFSRNLNRENGTSDGDENEDREDEGEKTAGGWDEPTSAESAGEVLFLDGFCEDGVHEFKCKLKLINQIKPDLIGIYTSCDITDSYSEL